MIMLAPHHHIRLVFSPKIKVPITADTIKLDAVDITVGTNVLASLAWRPLTKYRQTIAFAISIRQTKNALWTSDVS